MPQQGAARRRGFDRALLASCLLPSGVPDASGRARPRRRRPGANHRYLEFTLDFPVSMRSSIIRLMNNLSKLFRQTRSQQLETAGSEAVREAVLCSVFLVFCGRLAGRIGCARSARTVLETETKRASEGADKREEGANGGASSRGRCSGAGSQASAG